MDKTINKTVNKNLNYYQCSIQETMDSLKTSKDWLSNEEIIERFKIYDKNVLQEINKIPRWISFLSQFKDVLIILLIASMMISIYLEDYRWATILWIIIVINAIIWFVQETKAEHIMESLKKIIKPIAKVKRDGKLIEENVENLVPGDIVYIEEWDNIPADIRIIENNNCQCNDFSLTWESNPIAKFTHLIPGTVPLWERNNCLFMGTTVATGYARWIVTATWMYTELGRIANLSEAQDREETPLQHEMKNIAIKLTIWALILCWLLIIITLFAHFSIKEAFIFAIWIAAAMVPQWLPAQVSIALSLAAGRLAKNKALIKQLASVETLWCVNIICTDKTWTLTKNEMTVQKIYLWDHVEYDVTGTWYEANWKINSDSKTLEHLLNACVLSSNAKTNPPDTEHQTRYCIWDPTEWALITLAKKAWIDTDLLNERSKQRHQFWFDSIRKMMSSIRSVNKKILVYVKWAPDEILDRCTQIDNGKYIKKITKSDIRNIKNNIDINANQAMRNIAFAYKEIPSYSANQTMEVIENDLIFLWFVSIIDPPREEVWDAIQSAHNANIKIIMITGDYWPTAQAIATKIWLDKDWNIWTIPGEDLKDMSDIHLSKEMIEHSSLIFSRTSPEDKLRIVNLLRKTHNIVAVTWDWINDAPALKAANIWVAMWKIGTDVAKEASEIVLMDDSFHTLVYAIKEGRIIYQNMKKTIISCITSNGWELFVILSSLVGTALFNIPIAINIVQILAIDLIWEMWPLTSLTRDPAQKDLMKQKPRDTKEHIINKYTIIDLIRSGALMWFMWYWAYLLYFFLNNINPSWLDTNSIIYTTATSITYTTIIFCQYANIISRRAGITQHIFTSYLRSNKKFLWSIALWILLILWLIYTPIWQQYFWFWVMNLSDWLFPVIWGILYLSIRETYKIFIKKYWLAND